MAYLVLVRHGESLWNEKGLWTGWTDIGLTEKGKQEARSAGALIKSITFSFAYTSVLKRTAQTLEEIETVLGKKIPTISSPSLNERNYGDLTGKNKWDIKKEFGEEQFLKWRRGWNEPIKNGETLKDVYHRVIPYYTQEILPHLEKGENVLIVAHGNSLRALVKYLDLISDEDIANLEIATGEVYIYTIDEVGHVTNKEIKTATAS